MKNILLVGSHGLYGSYGGWDQLVNNFAKFKNNSYKLFIVSPKENNNSHTSSQIKTIHSSLSGFGFQGLLLDLISIIKYKKNIDCFLLLGAKGIISALLVKFFFNKRVIVNVGGVEWERPQYSKIIKIFLKICFILSVKYADVCILDNKHYLTFVKEKNRNKKNIKIIPYGGTISHVLETSDKYNFLNKKYFLSISRSIEDNKIHELCSLFKEKSNYNLVLISNLSKTEYGREIFSKFSNYKNIILIDGLYDKDELDLIRRNCFAYIHTHTLCGSAPSLIEMIVSRRPIISIDVPQNRFTLNNTGLYFKDFNQLKIIIEKDLISIKSCTNQLIDSYKWESIIRSYEEQMNVKF